MKFMALWAGVICCAQVLHAAAAPSLYSISLRDIDGQKTSLKAHQGDVLLIVNVASKCGLTAQYKALEALHQQHKAKGFKVLAFPCNDFGAQEPGTHQQIKEFCSSEYQVTFPIFEKVHVKGANQHPLFKALTGEESRFPGEIKWNFGKFLISRDGKLIKRFEPTVTPDSLEVVEAVEAALTSK